MAVRNRKRGTDRLTQFDVGESEGYYSVYEDYARSLRSWFVAYGVGGPVLLLTNESVREKVARSGEARSIAIFFLMGVALQVCLAAMNKTLMWCMYFGVKEPAFRRNGCYRRISWLARQYWIDLIVDLISIGLFSWATLRAFLTLAT